MKKLFKHKVLFLGFTIILTVNSFAADKILPKSKPQPDKEIVTKVKEKKHIYPKKKPDIKAKITKSAEIETGDQKEISIYPQKKPITFKKKADKSLLKSTILSKKDFDIAKSAFEAVDKRKWKTALKISKKARDKTVYKIVNYLYLIINKILDQSFSLLLTTIPHFFLHYHIKLLYPKTQTHDLL